MWYLLTSGASDGDEPLYLCFVSTDAPKVMKRPTIAISVRTITWGSCYIRRVAVYIFHFLYKRFVRPLEARRTGVTLCSILRSSEAASARGL